MQFPFCVLPSASCRLWFFLRLAGKIKTEDGEDFKQLVVHCIVKRSGNCSLQSDGTGKSVSVYRTGNGRNHLRTCQNLVVSVQRQKRQMSVVLYNKTVSVPCIGLLDSGNLLTMPLSGNPVHIADAALLQKLVDEKRYKRRFHTVHSEIHMENCRCTAWMG